MLQVMSIKHNNLTKMESIKASKGRKNIKGNLNLTKHRPITHMVKAAKEQLAVKTKHIFLEK